MKFDELISLVPFILLIGLSFYMVYGLWLIVESIFENFWRRIEFSLMSKKDISHFSRYEIHLRNRFPYYDRLPDNLKVKFLLRIKRFIAEKTFEGREDLVVTDEMKTWVAASAVQLTFGLNNFSLNHFSKIILYPDVYYNKQTDAMHKGEANTRGIIVLSWEDLKDGYSSPSDNFNLGLHEMAHALELQLLLKDDYDIFFGNYYEKWNMIAREEFENVESERASFFRKYAGTNKREFFAVCIEYFFESSEEFRQRLPEFYYHLSILLNQDPLQPDTKVKERLPKNNDELVLAIDSKQPVLIPEYDYWNLFVSMSYLGLALFFLIVKGFKDSPFLLYLAMVVGLIVTGAVLYRMNKIIFYENYLVIKSPLGRIKAIFELNDIIAIYISPRAKIEVYQARNGRVSSTDYFFAARDTDIVLLKELLGNKKIPVRI